MDFSWTDEQQALHERMRSLGEMVAALDPDERMARLAEHGVLGLCVAKEWGGGGYDLTTTAYAYEGLGLTLDDGGLLLAAGAHLFGVALTLQKVGTDEQRQRWLPSLASGKTMGTVAATEHDAGSNVGAVAAEVAEQGEGYRVAGEKPLVTYADRSQLFLFLGRQPEARALTMVVVEASRGGIDIGPRYDTVGLSNARLAPVKFNCTIASEDVLGRVGAGMAVFQIAMTYERALVLSFRIGAMQRALLEAVKFARQRKLAGQAIGKHQAVSQRIARMQLRVETARMMLYRAAWSLDSGRRAQADAALAKWHIAQQAVDNAMEAFKLRGGLGFMAEGAFHDDLGDAMGGWIHSGTGDVLPNIVSKWLGL